MLDRIPPNILGALATVVAGAAATLGYTLTEQAAAAVVVVIAWAIGGIWHTMREWDRGAK